MYSDYMSESNMEFPELTQLFHQHAEESILDEQLERILKPILARIDAGEFSKSRQQTIAKKTQAKKDSMTYVIASFLTIAEALAAPPIDMKPENEPDIDT